MEQQPLLQQVEDWLKSNSFSHRLQWEQPSFYLELPNSMQTYLSLRSGKFRNYLRRVEKKIAALGAVRFDVIQNTTDPEHAYEQLLQVERTSWKHDHGTAISAVTHQTGFYRDLCRGAAASGKLHLSFLYLNDEPIAYNLGYLHQQRYYYLKTSYQERFRAYGVATLGRARLIEQLVEQGVNLLDFPGEPYEWEQQWTESLCWHQSVAIYNRTVRGRMVYWMSMARRIATKDPIGKRLVFCDARGMTPPI